MACYKNKILYSEFLKYSIFVDTWWPNKQETGHCEFKKVLLDLFSKFLHLQISEHVCSKVGVDHTEELNCWNML